jgi:S1-C subfamily serine protease
MRIFTFLLSLVSCIPKENNLEANAIIAKSEIFLTCSKDNGCEYIGSNSTGSASRIVWDGRYYWLTAAHVCSSSFEKKDSFVLDRKIKAIVSGSNKTEEVDIIKIDYEKDLCLLSANKDKARRISKIEQGLGSYVYAVAYPGGIFDSNILPIYEGRWAGRADVIGKCIVTIPVSEGSSGAAVLNIFGDVVGVVSSVYVDFNHLTVVSCQEDILEFLLLK